MSSSLVRFPESTRETVAMETLASAATFVIELFAEVAEAEALSVVRAMLSSQNHSKYWIIRIAAVSQSRIQE